MIRSDHPLSPIYSTKNLAKKISRDQEREDKVSFVGPGNKTAILGKITVTLESFGEWYRKLLREVTELQEDLFGGIGFDDEEWLSVTVPEDLVDEVNTTRPGFCFGDLERNGMKKYEDAGLRALFHHPCLKDRFGTMLPGNKFVLNAVACHDFLRRSTFARTKTAVLLHISVGGTQRGSELASNSLRNHPQGDIRNVRVVNGEICLVGGYNKSSGVVSLSRKSGSITDLVLFLD